jgi:hypothetical protein
MSASDGAHDPTALTAQAQSRLACMSLGHTPTPHLARRNPGAVHLEDGTLLLLGVGKAHEAKALGPACVLVHDDLGARD